MKVRDLIEELQKLPSDATVVVQTVNDDQQREGHFIWRVGDVVAGIREDYEEEPEEEWPEIILPEGKYVQILVEDRGEAVTWLRLHDLGWALWERLRFNGFEIVREFVIFEDGKIRIQIKPDTGTIEASMMVAWLFDHKYRDVSIQTTTDKLIELVWQIHELE